MYATLDNFGSSNYVKVTYQVSWPGTDPMNAAYPAGPNDRRNYYGVTGVPNASLNGGANQIVYNVVSLNGGSPDYVGSNNGGLSGMVPVLTSNPTATTLAEDFTNAPLPSGTWQYSQYLPGAIFKNPDGLAEIQHTMNVELTVEEATDLQVVIVNALSQQVKTVANQHFAGSTNLSVNTSDLSNSVYFLNIMSDKGIQTERFVVSK